MKKNRLLAIAIIFIFTLVLVGCDKCKDDPAPDYSTKTWKDVGSELKKLSEAQQKVYDKLKKP